MRLTWKREPDERGLMAIGQGPRGYDLRANSVRIGKVRPMRKESFSREFVGWYWVACNDAIGISLENTCTTPVATLEEAKAQCLAYVKECLAKATGEGGGK